MSSDKSKLFLVVKSTHIGPLIRSNCPIRVPFLLQTVRNEWCDRHSVPSEFLAPSVTIVTKSKDLLGFSASELL